MGIVYGSLSSASPIVAVLAGSKETGGGNTSAASRRWTVGQEGTAVQGPVQAEGKRATTGSGPHHANYRNHLLV
jgi:hypothetical protein